jgi:DNA-binding NtrC family response regulator
MSITLRLADDHATIDLRPLPPDLRDALVADLELAVGRVRALHLRRTGEPAEPQPGVAAPSDPAAVERTHVQRALERAKGNKKLAAQLLGLSRRALYRRLERLHLGETITRRPAGSSI